MKQTKTLIFKSGEKLPEELIARWQLLENNALEDNFFLSPAFLLSAANHLMRDQDVYLIFVEDQTTADNALIFAAALIPHYPTWTKPFHILRSYCNSYSFLSGFLLHRDHIASAANAFFTFLASELKAFRTLDLLPFCAQGPQFAQFVGIAKNFGFYWILASQSHRAALFSNRIQELNYEKLVSKNIKRKRRALESMGDVVYKFLDSANNLHEAAKQFLQLEHKGWKGQNSTSLLSSPGDSQFFIELIVNAAERNQVFFTTIELNKEVICSSVNFISGKSVFAFKIARDESYKKLSLGILNEIYLLEQIPHRLRQVEYFDSGAQEGSYIESIWPDRIQLSSGYLTRSRFIKTLLQLKSLLKNIGSISKLSRDLKIR